MYEAYKDNFRNQLDNLTIASQKDMEVALIAHYLCMAYSDEDYISRLEQLAPKVPRSSCGDIDFAVRVLMTEDGQKLLSRASLLQTVNSNQCYFYYVRDFQTLAFQKEPAHTPGAELDHALVSLLSLELKEIYGTEVCIVKTQAKDELWVMEITHGGARQKEKNESHAEAVDMVRQPIETDCIIYDTKYDDLRIHMEKKRVGTMNLYCQTLGRALFLNEKWWKPGEKYGLHRFNIPREELQLMLARGAERLSNPTAGNLSLSISRVNYSEIKCLVGKASTENKHSISNKDGLNNALGEGERLVPQSATITSVSLRFTNKLKKKKQAMVITISGKKRTLESEMVPNIEDWLHDEGIC